MATLHLDRQTRRQFELASYRDRLLDELLVRDYIAYGEDGPSIKRADHDFVVKVHRASKGNGRIW